MLTDHFLKQIEKIKQLDDGWLDGGGSRFEAPSISSVVTLANQITAQGLPHGFVYPTGGDQEVSFEWDLRAADHDWSVSLEFNCKTKKAQLDVLDVLEHAGWAQVTPDFSFNYDFKNPEEVDCFLLVMIDLWRKAGLLPPGPKVTLTAQPPIIIGGFIADRLKKELSEE